MPPEQIPPQPNISPRPGRIDFDWPTAGLTVAVRHLHTHTNGRTTAHLVVRTTGRKAGLVHRGDITLSGTRAKKELAKALTEALPIWDWGVAVELICDRTLNWLEQGEPVETVLVDPEETLEPPAYLLYPLLPQGMVSIAYGEGGTAKSTFAIAIMLAAQLPWETNPLGLVPPPHPVTGLFLDWEMDKETFKWRSRLLLRGHQLPAIELLYRHCSAPLAADIETYQDMVADLRPEFLVIDSLGMAAGGELNKAESPLGFFAALRQLKITALVIAHSGKDEGRGIYGNVYFRNMARAVWECRKQQETGSNSLTLALVDRKQNLSKSLPPLGYKFTFDQAAETLTISQTDPRSVDGVIERLGVSYQILQILREGVLPVADIIEKVGPKKAAQVRNRLSDLKRAGKVVLLPDKSWGLATRAAEDDSSL